jgi:pimeloyl-ACP methyl ester carboxylesterase
VFTRGARTSRVWGALRRSGGGASSPRGELHAGPPGSRNKSGAVHDTFTPSHRGGSGSPLVCLHGFTDTWRTWELVLPALERRHDVLAPTLPGHAGGPPLTGDVDGALLADAVERAMDEAGFGSAHIVGNSLGGYVALQLAVPHPTPGPG